MLYSLISFKIHIIKFSNDLLPCLLRNQEFMSYFQIVLIQTVMFQFQRRKWKRFIITMGNEAFSIKLLASQINMFCIFCHISALYFSSPLASLIKLSHSEVYEKIYCSFSHDSIR